MCSIAAATHASSFDLSVRMNTNGGGKSKDRKDGKADFNSSSSSEEVYYPDEPSASFEAIDFANAGGLSCVSEGDGISAVHKQMLETKELKGFQGLVARQRAQRDRAEGNSWECDHLALASDIAPAQFENSIVF